MNLEKSKKIALVVIGIIALILIFVYLVMRVADKPEVISITDEHSSFDFQVSPFSNQKRLRDLASQNLYTEIEDISFTFIESPTTSTLIRWVDGESDPLAYIGFDSELIDGKNLHITLFVNKAAMEQVGWSPNMISEELNLTFFRVLTSFQNNNLGEAESARAVKLYNEEQLLPIFVVK